MEDTMLSAWSISRLIILFIAINAFFLTHAYSAGRNCVQYAHAGRGMHDNKRTAVNLAVMHWSQKAKEKRLSGNLANPNFAFRISAECIDTKGSQRYSEEAIGDYSSRYLCVYIAKPCAQ
jgi:hypothetical protein